MSVGRIVPDPQIARRIQLQQVASTGAMNLVSSGGIDGISGTGVPFALIPEPPDRISEVLLSSGSPDAAGAFRGSLSFR